MRKRINPTLVGLFVILGIAILIMVILYLGVIRGGGDRMRNVTYFPSETKGLDVGAPVVLQGVQIGRVTDIEVGFDDELEHFYVRVEYESDREIIKWPHTLQDRHAKDPDTTLDEMIGKGLRARLALQSVVTGKLLLELGFFPDTKAYRRGDKGEIPSIPTTIDKLFDELSQIDLQEMAQGIGRIVEGLDKTINDPAIGEILVELKQMLAGINRVVDELQGSIGPVGENLNATLVDIRRLVNHVDDRVDGMAGSIEKAGDQVGELAQSVEGQLPPLISDLRSTARSVDNASSAATRALTKVDILMADNSPLQVELLSSLRNLSAAARSLKNFADYLERHPEALLKGKR